MYNIFYSGSRRQVNSVDRLFQMGLEYSRVSDIAVMALCIVMAVLLLTSYVSRTRSYRIFTWIIGLIFVTAFVNIGYHCLLDADNAKYLTMIHVMRLLFFSLLFLVFFLFALYATEVSGLEHHQARNMAMIACALLAAVVGIEAIRILSGTGWQITEAGKVKYGEAAFMFGYVLYILLLIVLLLRIQRLLYKRVMYGFYGTMVISVLLMFGQLLMNQSSLITMTFIFPVIAMMYIMHSNPYNITLGTVDQRSMEDHVRNLHSHGKPFLIVSFLLPDYNEEGMEMPEEIQSQVRTFTSRYFRQAVLFQISNGHVMLLAPRQANVDFEQRVHAFEETFKRLYERLHYPFKVVIGESIDEISRKNEYVSLIRSIHRRMPENTFHRINSDDIISFNREEYILHELADISAIGDRDDSRVKAFCQPVFNLQSGCFDTAEILMRLDLKETGTIYPDQFIPMAEAHGYIHGLTEIILYKTCQEIQCLIREGYDIRRVSVNVSVLELKDDTFCDDINRIIDMSGIPGDKIAIELTESGNEEDFILMKGKIETLQDEGIKFYLDDFGTGYSNMERIMELPFDIIKFDRSLVMASRTDERSRKIVESMAQLFNSMGYAVLYEGIEDAEDEERFRGLSASYLQGYMYSRPVPIEKLRSFLDKTAG